MTEVMIHAFEREKLRLYGPVPEEGHWRRRWNSEIYGLYKDLNIVDGIKFRRLDLRVTSYEWKNKGSEKKRVSLENFTKQNQLGNQEQDGRMFVGMPWRS